MVGKVVGWATKQKCGSSAAKLILMVLADRADNCGASYPTLRTISADTGFCEKTVRKHIGTLVRCDLLDVHPRITPYGQRSNVYVLNAPAEMLATKSNLSFETVKNASTPAHRVEGAPWQCVEGPTTNPQSNPTTKPDEPPSAFADARFERLIQEIGIAQYRTWFHDAIFESGPPIMFHFDNKMMADIARGKYLPKLISIFGGEVRIEFRPVRSNLPAQ